MMDGAHTPDLDAVRVMAERYADAVYYAKADVFEDMCHKKFQMTHVKDGGAEFWDKDAYLKRVSGRDPFSGEASYEILNVDVAGGEIARVHLWVDVPPARYEDHLGFIRVNEEWKLLTKVFRTMATLAQEG